jgi:hypothetical protein
MAEVLGSLGDRDEETANVPSAAEFETGRP